MATKKLPEKLSDCIDLALTDLAAVEKSKDYIVDMWSWHDPTYDDNGKDQCLVCFAGAVMAKTLKVATDEVKEPYNFDKHTERRLFALDTVREGCIDTALKIMDIDTDFELTMYVPEYERNKAGFKKSMRQTATLLRNLGY